MVANLSTYKKLGISKISFLPHSLAASAIRAVAGMPLSKFNEDYEFTLRELEGNAESHLKFPMCIVSG